MDCESVHGMGVVGGAAAGMLLGSLFGGGGGERWRPVPVFSGGQP